jgi:hypothetical protein
VIGDFIGAVGNGTVPPSASLQPFPSMQMHESEIGLQAIIDPYARGDFFLSFGEEGVNLEEKLHHLHCPARRIRGESRQDALSVW